MDHSSISELRQFLTIQSRPDVQATAIKLLLSLSVDVNFRQLIFTSADTEGLIDDICVLFVKTKTESIKCLLLAFFINLTDEHSKIAAKLLHSDSILNDCFVQSTSQPPNKCSVHAAQLLSNLSRLLPDGLHEKLVSNDSQFLCKIIECFSAISQTREETESREIFLGFLLLNLSFIRPTNRVLALDHLPRLTFLLGCQEVPPLRRMTALDIVYNLAMFDELHELLLRDEDELLSALLWPLLDADDQLDDEEMAQLPIQLQYWEGRRQPEERGSSTSVSDKVLRTLYQLCATRYGRQCLRRKGVYALLRELDKATTVGGRGGAATVVGEGRICTFVGGTEAATAGEKHFDVLRALIGVLIRTEEEMGADASSFSIRQLGSSQQQSC